MGRFWNHRETSSHSSYLKNFWLSWVFVALHRFSLTGVKSEREVAQSCPTLRDPMDCSLAGSSLQGIFQARVLVGCHCLLWPVVAAAAKSLQSCPTLCDPIDGSPPGSAVPGTLQARTWSGLPFPSPMHESGK